MGGASRQTLTPPPPTSRESHLEVHVAVGLVVGRDCDLHILPSHQPVSSGIQGDCGLAQRHQPHALDG